VEESCQSVDDVICGMKDTTIFCDMVTSFSKVYKAFADGLEGGRPYTVFAFTDDAYRAVEEELLELSPVDIYRTLLFHFYEDVVLTYKELDCATKLTSLTGDLSRTKCRRISAGVYDKSQRGKGNQEIGDWPKIQNGSREACTGIVHRIDKIMLPVLFPPFEAFVGADNTNANTDDNTDGNDAIVVVPEIVDANSVYFNSDEEDEDEFPAFVIDTETTVVPEEEGGGDASPIWGLASATAVPTLPETEAEETLPETEADNGKGKDVTKEDKEDDNNISNVSNDAIEEINNNVIGIGSATENSAISWGDTYVDLGEVLNTPGEPAEEEEIEVTPPPPQSHPPIPTLADIDFDPDDNDPQDVVVGGADADGYVAGTKLEITEVSDAETETAAQEALQLDNINNDTEGIGAVLGINLVVFSALIIFFFVWISRMLWCPETNTFRAIRSCMVKRFKKPITVSVARTPKARDRNTSNKSGCWMPGAQWTPNRNGSSGNVGGGVNNGGK